MRNVARRGQHTLRRVAELQGIGLHSGECVKMALVPAVPGTGIIFSVNSKNVKAHFSNVSPSELCTTIESDGASVATVEHLMAAFAASGVSNCLVEVSSPEIPIMDGSMLEFMQTMQEHGIEHQACPTPYVEVVRPGDTVCDDTPKVY